MNLPSTHWPTIKAVFDATIDLPAAQREPLIQASGLEVCALRELRSLLAHHDQVDAGPGFMAGSAAQALAEAPVLASRAGQRLGAWEIVRPIGAGGMGEVFEARRADGQFDGRAAVKLLKRGMDSAAVLQRFALERQALARLSHPHIARLLDAGASDEGLPYFVLEYVDGRPIDQAVRGQPLQARLAAFLQLADAVAHAHCNLLVHRDLKPGNVLVDNQGQVKLLDFGIAKALDPLEGDDGHSTVGGERPYTPQHASPEQIRGEPVSTATDIYSLGVLLYQMLTGTRPTGRSAGTRAEVARSVLEDEPTRPSRLSAREALDPNWVQTRRLLEGDLDNILLKTLEKSVDRRYRSVEALAADLQAVIDGRPVSARPASPAYVLGKFLRRHRWAVLAGGLGGLGAATGLAAALLQGRVAAALGALGLTAGLAIALLQGRKAELARASAERHVAELRQLSRDVVVEYGDAITYVPGGMERKAAMLTTTLGYMDRLAQAATDDPVFLGEVGSLYARLADLRTSGEFNAAENPAEAEAHARRAIQLFATAAPDPSAQTLDIEAWRWWSKALGVLAKAAQTRGELQRALQHLQGADAVLQRGLRAFDGDAGLRRARADTLMLVVQLRFGYGRPNLGQPDEALSGLDEAQALYAQAAAGPGPAAMQDVFQLGTVASTRAMILARLERWTEAITAAQQAVEQRERASTMEPHNRVVRGGVAADLNLLGGLYLNVGDPARALGATRLAWSSLDRLMAEDPDNQTWLTQRRFLALNHGRALLGSGDLAAAEVALQLSANWLAPLAATGQATPAQRRRHAQTLLAQAEVAYRSGKVDAGDSAAAQAEAALRALVAEEPADREHARVHAACVALRSRRPADGP